MKKMKGDCSTCGLTADEVEVMNILLNLRHIIRVSESFPPGFYHLPRWGFKRRRSNRSSPAAAAKCKGKKEALSPQTPFSFCPYEHPRNRSNTRTRDQLMSSFQDLKQNNDVLIGELKNVRFYHSKQKAYNLKLKTKKQELLTGSSSSIGPGTSAAQQDQQNQHPAIVDPPGQSFQNQMDQMSPRQPLSDSRNGSAGYATGASEVNVSADGSMGAMVVGSAQPFDLQRMERDNIARCARRNRMIIIKLKKSRSHIGSRPRRR